MNPQSPCCNNPECPARGCMGQRSIGVHSQRGQRSRGKTCSHTFTAAKGTPFYRL
jgi:hypothetical protein